MGKLSKAFIDAGLVGHSSTYQQSYPQKMHEAEEDHTNQALRTDSYKVTSRIVIKNHTFVITLTSDHGCLFAHSRKP